MMSCNSFVSEFYENEEILDYTYYINEGWNAFEVVNLSDTILVDQHMDYYNLALTFFNAAIQAIQSEYFLTIFLTYFFIPEISETSWAW